MEMVMARNTLKGMRIAILVTDGFEQVELVKPRSALDESGALTQIVSPKDGHVRSWNLTDWGVPFPVVSFVKAFFDAGKPVAAICHGPWTVIEAGAARGRRMTSWPSLRTDLRNAGADWVDQDAVVDQGLVTSRSPDDIPAFNRETIKLFGEAFTRAHAA
jgi:protease I